MIVNRSAALLALSQAVSPPLLLAMLILFSGAPVLAGEAGRQPKADILTIWGSIPDEEKPSAAEAAVPAQGRAQSTTTTPPVFQVERAAGSSSAEALPEEIWQKKLSLDLREARVGDVLRLLGDTYKLNIIAGGDLSKTITISLHEVPMRDAFDLILKLNGYRYTIERSVVIVQGGGSDLVSKVVLLKHAKPAEVEKVMTAFLAKAGIQGQLAVLENPTRVALLAPGGDMKALTDLLDSLDRRPQQVIIRASIITVDANSLFNLGVQWGAPGTSSRSGIDATRTTTDAAGNSVTSTQTSLLTFPQPRSSMEALTGNFSFPGTSTLLSGGQVTLGTWVDQLVFDATIDAMVSQCKAKVLSQPKIGVLSHETAKIVVGQKVKYNLSTTATGSGNVVEDSEFVEAGIGLEVTPVVGDDGFVTIKIKPQVSSFIGDITQSESPPIQTTEAETTVCVKDGHTAVIGGLVSRVDRKADNGMPVLRNIPLVKFFFSSKSSTWTQQELIVLITPQIVQTGEDWPTRGSELENPQNVPWKKNAEHLNP